MFTKSGNYDFLARFRALPDIEYSIAATSDLLSHVEWNHKRCQILQGAPCDTNRRITEYGFAFAKSSLCRFDYEPLPACDNKLWHLEQDRYSSKDLNLVRLDSLSKVTADYRHALWEPP